ncbi:MAG: DUF1836 domain-containing protein [Clostridia bacterium]|nr:DUF1836 domain-containing protein [Clostridia bacterium]
MNINEMEALIGEAVRDADLRPEEIPAIDLYLDQITSLVSEKRRDASPMFEDRVLTKTMINNYSKDGLLSPIKGKKYSKEQILQMLLVYEMKNTLSIGEIKRILQNVYALPEYDAQMLEGIYRRYLDIKESERENTCGVVRGFMEQTALDAEDDADFFTLLLGLAAMSSYLKNTVQILLENRYPDLNAEKTREEQEKKEEEKRRKAAQKAEAKRQKIQKEKEAKANDTVEGEKL